MTDPSRNSKIKWSNNQYQAQQPPSNSPMYARNQPSPKDNPSTMYSGMASSCYSAPQKSPPIPKRTLWSQDSSREIEQIQTKQSVSRQQFLSTEGISPQHYPSFDDDRSKTFKPLQSSFQLSSTPSPIIYNSYDECPSNPYYGQYQYGEYIGIPLEPHQPRSFIVYNNEEETGPSTAEIIANQSQDYIDEKLAEYQMTILQLQEEQERVQKKTFVNWINSYLSKRIPPLRLDDLIEDLKDGTKLIALLEILSGEKLPVEKGRVLRRPHFLSNANTALQFLANKKIKLVNINPSDLVDGRPPVVLGLIWTIILYFQIEENSRDLQFGERAFSGSLSSLDGAARDTPSLDLKAERWKQGARKTLLQWVTNALPKDAGVEIRDFGVSWRDGVAFLALIDGIRANLINLAELKKSSNRVRLETAFDIAEAKLGITKLLDAEDVDVEKPDEKSIMTYVAQFLQKYPEPREVRHQTEKNWSVQLSEVIQWLHEKIDYFKSLAGSYPPRFDAYLAEKSLIERNHARYVDLCKRAENDKTIFIESKSLEEAAELWNVLDSYLHLWLWNIDMSLCSELLGVTKWLCGAEKLILEEKLPETMNEETASLISCKLEEHKSYFSTLPQIIEKFEHIVNTIPLNEIHPEYLNILAQRLHGIGSKATERRVKLKFLEHKCCLIAFLNLVENKLKNWNGKHGYKEDTQNLLDQYKNFVSKNKIFQEFSKALADMQQVIEEYKRDGNISKPEFSRIDAFMTETQERWKQTSHELICCQTNLEENVSCWNRFIVLESEISSWLNAAENMLTTDENEKQEFFQDIAQWQEKYNELVNTATFLIVSCTDIIAQDIEKTLHEYRVKWENIFPKVKQYMHAGELIRQRKEYKHGIESLSNWLRSAEQTLKIDNFSDLKYIKEYGEELNKISADLEHMEQLFKNISKIFQCIIKDLSRNDVNNMMSDLKKEKEALVQVRSELPIKLQLYHQLLVQHESMEKEHQEISQWLDKAENLLASHAFVFVEKEKANERLHVHKTFFSRSSYYKTILESKNNFMISFFKTQENSKKYENSEAFIKMRQLNDRFNYVINHAAEWEQKLKNAIEFSLCYNVCERKVTEWLSQAEVFLTNSIVPSSAEISKEKEFFEQANEQWISALVEAGQFLLPFLNTDEQSKLVQTVENLQSRWKSTLEKIPSHLMKKEFQINERNLYENLEKADLQLIAADQRLSCNESVDLILESHKSFFGQECDWNNINKCLENMHSIAHTYMQLNPKENSLLESYKNAKSFFNKIVDRVEETQNLLQQIPATLNLYREKFSKMEEWMNTVDESLKNISREVNTTEEFEKEKISFQRICQDAENKREDMKWLVKTLDSLLSYATNDESLLLQKKLEALINRYKNLIPTIEVAMVRTEVFSKCYTYRREVHEVVCLLEKVKGQTLNTPQPSSLENTDKMIQEQQYAIEQLNHQRPHILSMLQRGKDLSKDTYAPSFIHDQIKELETGWNETYGETVQHLKILQNTHSIWMDYTTQQNKIMEFLENAVRELDYSAPLQPDGHEDIIADLNKKRELDSTLQRVLNNTIPKLLELSEELKPLTSIDTREMISKQVANMENRFLETAEDIKKLVFCLEDYSQKWKTYCARLFELEEWAKKFAARVAESLEDENKSPQEKIADANRLQANLMEKIYQCEDLASKTSQLEPKNYNIASKAHLTEEIHKLHDMYEVLRSSLDTKYQDLTDDLVRWNKHEAEIETIAPLIEKYESSVKELLIKPQTFAETMQLQLTSKGLENACQAQLSKLQEISEISSKTMYGVTPVNNVQALYSKCSALSESAKQITNRLDNVIVNWKNFEEEADKMNGWLDSGEKVLSAQADITQSINMSKLENELTKLKLLSNEISEQHAKLIAITQTANQIASSLSPEASTMMKHRVLEMKSKLNKLAENTRCKMNQISDIVMKRQDFNLKVENFVDWMDKIDIQNSQIGEIYPESVEDVLQTIHFLIQEHSEKMITFEKINNEFEKLAEKAKPEDLTSLKHSASYLTDRFMMLERTLQQKKTLLEKYGEFLSWKNETNNFLTHIKQNSLNSAEPRQNSLGAVLEELDKESKTLPIWKEQAKDIDSSPLLRLCITSNGKPISALQSVNGIDYTIEEMKISMNNIKDIMDETANKSAAFHDQKSWISRRLSESQNKLENILNLKPNNSNIEQIISDLCELNNAIQLDSNLLGDLHSEGETLMKLDTGKVPLIQDTLVTLDKTWADLQKEMTDNIEKYTLLREAFKDYVGLKGKIDDCINKAEFECNALNKKKKNDEHLRHELNKTRDLFNYMKKEKNYFDELDRKVVRIGTLFDIVCKEAPNELYLQTNELKARFNQINDKIGKHLQKCETSMIMWTQIQDTKSELSMWLTEINQQLCDSIDDTLQASPSLMLLSKYKSELPAYEALNQNIKDNATKLFQYDQSIDTSPFEEFHQCAAEKFAEIAHNANRLEGIILSFNEQEVDLQKKIKLAGDKIYECKEGITKCDDLTGNGDQIVERIKQCKHYKKNLDLINGDLQNLNQRVDEIKKLYPSYSESTIPKDLSCVMKRYESINLYNEKVKSTLHEFLRKLHSDNICTLKRMVDTQKEKIAWCCPESSSDKYNLDVKTTSLQEAQTGINECMNFLSQASESMKNLADTESANDLRSLQNEMEEIKLEIGKLNENYSHLKSALEENVKLWSDYNNLSEQISSWLKEFEDKTKIEASSMVDLKHTIKRIADLKTICDDMTEKNEYLKELQKIAAAISLKNPEARAEQFVGHIATRWSNINKSMSSYIDRMEQVEKRHEEYINATKLLENWLDESKLDFIELARMGSPGSSSATAQQVETIKTFVQRFPEGQALINNVSGIGESLFPVITSESRDSIRSELRKFREILEDLIDESNALLQQTESVLIQKTSVEESHEQISNWIKQRKNELENESYLFPSLSAKKQAHQNCKLLIQEINSHKIAVMHLKEKAALLTNDEFEGIADETIIEFEELGNNIHHKMNALQDCISNHESYNRNLEQAQDWLNAIKPQIFSLLNESSLDKNSPEEKLAFVENLIQQLPEGKKLFELCETQLNSVLQQTHLQGRPTLVTVFEEARKGFIEFVTCCEDSKVHLEQLSTKRKDFEDNILQIDTWLRNSESIIKDHSLKNTASMKENHLKRLNSLLEDTTVYSSKIAGLIDEEAEIEGLKDLHLQLSRLNTRVQTLKNICKESIAKYEIIVRDHKSFDSEYKNLCEKLLTNEKEVSQVNDLQGNLDTLRNRQKKINDMIENRLLIVHQYEAILDAAEKLYIHTSPDGREIIRQQILSLNNRWDSFTNNLNKASHSLDNCLSQYDEFTIALEQFNKWLKDADGMLNAHTAMKTTLQEKRAVFQNHKLLHQEIVAHEDLMKNICNRGKTLLRQTSDRGLQLYLDPIEALYKNVAAKSSELLAYLESCVDAHSDSNTNLAEVKARVSKLKEKLLECDDTSGEKSDVNRKLNMMNEILQEANEIPKLIEDCRGKLKVVENTTTAEGCHILMQDLADVDQAADSLTNDIVSSLGKQREILKQWDDFEISNENLTEWCRGMEQIFRNQQLKSSLEEKTAQLADYKEKMISIGQKEAEIDKFINNAHVLLNNSNVDRIKTVVAQLANRYNCLQALSKDVLHAWQTICQDHKDFSDKIKELNAWLQSIEQNVENASQDANNEMLQIHFDECQRGKNEIINLRALMEKVIPESSAAGREIIRQEEKNIRCHCDQVIDKIKDIQKLQQVRSAHLGNYQDIVRQMSMWLDSVEEILQSEAPTHLTPPPEIRSKLLKFKSVSQEVSSHRKKLEALDDKVSKIVEIIYPADSNQIHKDVSEIKNRFEKVADQCQLITKQLETAFDAYQGFSDLQRNQREYQKNLWDRLTAYSNYTGNKALLQANLGSILEMQSAMDDDKKRFLTLSNCITNHSDTIPQRSQEVMERELRNLQVDYEKFTATLIDVKCGLENRLQQLSENEANLEQLLGWVDSVESELKNYTAGASLDEKLEQLSKYQQLISVIRQNEADFEKLKQVLLELNDSTSEAKISAAIQQVSSRFQSVLSTAREILRKCEHAVQDHQKYIGKQRLFSEWLTETHEKCKDCRRKIMTGSRESLLNNRQIIFAVQTLQNNAVLMLNTMIESGEKCYPTTSPDGIAVISTELHDMQDAFEQICDEITRLSQMIQEKQNQWNKFDEIAANFEAWLRSLEVHIHPHIELKTTLDEKRAKLVSYRDLLCDIHNHKTDLTSLEDMTKSLPQKTEIVDNQLELFSSKYNEFLSKCNSFVDMYEVFVSDHQCYSKAVMNVQEFIEATLNTVHLWGDLDLDCVSLKTNLQRLKNLQECVNGEYSRVTQVSTLGEKVIPGTVETGKANIQSQIDSTQLEWDGLLSTINSVISSIEVRLQQWSDYDNLRDQCLHWILETDNLISSVDLKPTLIEKKKQCDILKTLQGEVLAKELEIDEVAEKGQHLSKNPLSVRDSHLSELVIKYQQISHKIKDLTNRWQNYVASHRDYDNNMNQTCVWIENIKSKLDYCSNVSAISQKDLENKLGTIRDIIFLKDQGSSKIQHIVENAQEVLANTAPDGHSEINKSLTKLQDEWAAIVLRMHDIKAILEDSIYQWSDFLNLAQNVKKFNNWIENSLQELSEIQGTIPEKRAQLDRIKTMEEKVRMEKIEVDALREKSAAMVANTSQNQAAIQAQVIFDAFDKLANKAKKLLAEREEQYRDHKLYKEAYDDLNSWIGRAREKLPLVVQVSLDDKSTIEKAVVAIDALLNKKAQGELLIEHLIHRGEVVLNSTSPQGVEIIRNDIRSIRECFEELFKEIAQKKHSLGATMNLWRSYKDEYEKLLEWLQQIDILVKNHKLNLVCNVAEKQKQVEQMQEISKKLENGKTNVEEFKKQSAGLLSSIVSNCVQNQLQLLDSMYQAQCNVAKDVLKKLETNYEQHKEYEKYLQKANEWITHAQKVISSSSEPSPTASRDDLLKRLDEIKGLINTREEGQGLVHMAINTSEKILRNTRSDGRDIINTQIKDLQNDWERTIKKLSSAKVHIETDLLQWADYSSSCNQLQQLITDREVKLQQASEQRITLSKKGQPGLISGLSERKANLRHTNSIVQDIVSLEPMIQSVTSKASGLQQAPVNEISTKYETLSKQAKYIYEKQKETIEYHQALLDAGNEFAQWLRNAKERLGKCSEPTGDKELLASKTTQLRILEGETADGKAILQKVLHQGEIACSNAAPEDREIIEEEVAILQEEFDLYIDALKNAKSYLEVGIVKWTDYQNQYNEALAWLANAEALVQSFTKLHQSLDQKKIALEQFQQHLQTLFDWQKELDSLNVKAQTLLEVCSDTRISNGITQLTTKYNALLTVAKEVMRRLELQYQEHQQHHALYEECQLWLENTKEKLCKLEEIPSTLSEVQIKLNTLKGIRQAFEQGQNKLRYLLELKEKVVINTEGNGVGKIQEDTELLKQDFDTLLEQIGAVKHSLSNRASQLEDIYKPYKLLTEWLDEIESNVPEIEKLSTDLGNKKLILEKLRSFQRDVSGHSDIVEKINAKLIADTTLNKTDFNPGLEKFVGIQEKIAKAVENMENQVNNHEKYRLAYQQIQTWCQQTKLKIEKNADCYGEKYQIVERIDALHGIEDEIPENKEILDNVENLSNQLIITSECVGQNPVLDEIEQLHTDWDCLLTLLKNSQKKLEACLAQWSYFDNKVSSINNKINSLKSSIENESQLESTPSEYLGQCEKFLADVLAEKESIEGLNDDCDALLELSACVRVRDIANELHSDFTKLLTAAQGMLAKAEKDIKEQTDFNQTKLQMENWMKKANETIDECYASADLETAEKNFNTLKMLNDKLPEGLCLLTAVQDCYNKTISKVCSDPDEPMDQVIELRAKWDDLVLNIREKLADLRQIKNNWHDFVTNKSIFEQWLNETEKELDQEITTTGDLAEMKIVYERYKTLKSDIEGKNIELESLAAHVRDLNAEPHIINPLIWKINSLNTNCSDKVKAIESELNESTSYLQSLQDVEKWLLQISFKLMAHNSLYITSLQQIKVQLEQHEALLCEIQSYRATLDDLTQKGKKQISRYQNASKLKTTIEDQLTNIDESYNSLLKTALQIKTRLNDSLCKFQIYEDTLSSIMKCLEEYKQQIESQLDFRPHNLETAKQRLKDTQDWDNRLQIQKTKLAEAVQACEAAASSVSRPSSPFEASIVAIPEHELAVRAMLEDLIDQVQGHMNDAELHVTELEQLQNQKSDLVAWVLKQKDLVSDFESKPCKLRLEISKQELNTLNDILNTVGDKRSEYLTTLRGTLSDEESDSTDMLLDDLESSIMHVIAKKQKEQDIIDVYRNWLQGTQTWFDTLAKRIDVSDKGCGLTCAQKMSAINAINTEFKNEGPNKIEVFMQHASNVVRIISNLEGQQVSEQIKSIQKRFADIEKRIMRKIQVFETANKQMDSIKEEISLLQNYFEEKCAQLVSIAPSDYSAKAATQLEQSIKTIQREVESKQSLIDTIDKRMANIHHELEPIEYNQLETHYQSMINRQNDLIELLSVSMSKASDAAETRKKLEAKVEMANTWLRKKTTEIRKVPNNFPLAASAIEKDIEVQRKYMTDVNTFKENSINDISSIYTNIIKQYPATETSKSQAEDAVEILSKNIDSLKKELEEKINNLSGMLMLRKAIENNIKSVNDWMVGAEISVSSKVHASSLPILKEQSTKYKLLAEAAKPFGQVILNIVEQGKIISASLSTADKLKLAEEIKHIKNRYNQITRKIDDNCKSIEDIIKRKKDAKDKFEECVRILGVAQQRLRELNKPVGGKIDDVQEVFGEYERILEDLKANRNELNELDLIEMPESKSIADQHDEMIKMIEGQLVNLRNLLLLREQFITLINDVTNFIIKNADVIKDIEDASSPIEGKINQYDNLITEIQMCEAFLASAYDKGQKIASEGVAADRNNIAEQLQSLKNQLQNLRTSVEEQREKHQANLSEHSNLKGELAMLLNMLHENEVIVKSRPLLDRDPDSVEREIQKHAQIVSVVNDLLNKVDKLCRVDEVGLPSSLIEMISEAQSLVASLPSELDDRMKYLATNKTLRLDFIALESKFNSWLNEAASNLQNENDGVDFPHLKSDLDRLQKFFESKSSIKDLLSKQIQDVADQIWPSLNSLEQEELNSTVHRFHENLTNTLEKLNAQLAQTRGQVETWQQYQQLLEELTHKLNAAQISEGKIDDVNDLQKHTMEVATNLDNIKHLREDLDGINQISQSIIRQGNVQIRTETERDIQSLNQLYSNMLTSLQNNLDHSVLLTNQWNELEMQITILEDSASALEQKVSQLKDLVKSRKQLEESRSTIQELFVELESHKESYSKAQTLSEVVLQLLGSRNELLPDRIYKRLQNISDKESRLTVRLTEYACLLDKHLSYIEDVFKNLSRLQDTVGTLLEESIEMDIYDTNVDSVDRQFDILTCNVNKSINEGKELIDSTNSHYKNMQSIIPCDVQQELMALELLSERLQGTMEEMENEIKSIKSLRLQYSSVIDEIQKWMKNAEVQINDTSIELVHLKEIINKLNGEFDILSESLEKSKECGKLIMEKTRSYDEKKLIENTFDEITKQLNQSRGALVTRKQIVEDCIDAWTRFLNLYQMVIIWVSEKEVLGLSELKISTLLEAKEAQNNYSSAVNTVKVVSKHLSEMGNILEMVLQVSVADDLKQKLHFAEESKMRVEALLFQRLGLLQEMTEEWEQCEKKIRDIRVWVETSKSLAESMRVKNQPLKDQLGLCEKCLLDINVQKTKLSLSIEKLQVHFRCGIGSDLRICQNAQEVSKILDELTTIMRKKAEGLEKALQQIDTYQQHIQSLKFKIIEEENALRSLLIPIHAPMDTDCTSEQQICRQKIKCLQHDILIRKDRIKDIIKRGIPDESFENFKIL